MAKKPRQKSLPKMGPVKNSKIESLAERFVDARDEWQALNRPMVDARDLLEIAMKEAKLRTYEFDGNEIGFEASEKLFVRKKKEPKASKGEA